MDFGKDATAGGVSMRPMSRVRKPGRKRHLGPSTLVADVPLWYRFAHEHPDPHRTA